jgi:hypothetical protein
MARIELGERFYIFAPDDSFDAADDHLLISAHGGYMNLFGPLGRNQIRVPAWTQLYFYADHGSTIQDPGVYNIMKGEYQVSETKGPGSVVTDYSLSKYQGRHGGGDDETYAKISEQVTRNASVLADVGSGKNKGRNFAYKFHVLTVRNRRLRSDPDLSDVLAALTAAQRQYQNIHCSFCRSPMLGSSGDAAAKKFGT